MATWSLGGALFLVWGLLALWYGPRVGFWLIAPPPGGHPSWPWRATALVGAPLNLFSVLGSSWCWAGGWTTRSSSGDAKAGTAAGVLGVTLAAFLTLVSYGLLAFSHTPALKGFGIVLGWGVLGTYLTSFLSLRSPPMKRLLLPLALLLCLACASGDRIRLGWDASYRFAPTGPTFFANQLVVRHPTRRFGAELPVHRGSQADSLAAVASHPPGADPLHEHPQERRRLHRGPPAPARQGQPEIAPRGNPTGGVACPRNSGKG